MKIKNWSKFQHFKDRKPPWIKLYRDILDDINWFELSGDDAKILVQLWLIASEDENKEGELPCIRQLSFRFRMSEVDVSLVLLRLKHWLILDDIKVISRRCQDATPETETETDSPATIDNISNSVILRDGGFFDSVTGEAITTPFD